MIHCSDQFEVYDTQSLEDQESLVTNYGAERRVSGVRNSLATGERHAHKQAITFLDGLTLKKLYRDTNLPENPVKVDTLMELDLQPYPYTWASDAFVFDGMVAARINGTAFNFFLYPLVESQAVAPLPMHGPVESFGREEAGESD